MAMAMADQEMEAPAKKKFKQFDIISGAVSSDHHFYTSKSNNSDQATKKIVQEWKILEKNLPESIFVRVYENRIDLLRAVIVGSSGTPYHNGIFFFDFQFPSDYPSKPPKVHYHSYGLRLNPNLYSNGYVCLSLLNTWFGKKDERWVPSKSTILQVLVSIQGLVLNEEPYFNEPLILPGKRIKQSLAYNEEIFLLSCKTMLYVASKPPEHFKEFVAVYFHDHSEAILKACKAYINGGKFSFSGLLRNGSSSSSSIAAAEKKASKGLKKSMEKIYPKMERAFLKGKSSLGNFIKEVQVVEECASSSSSKPHPQEEIVVEGCGFLNFGKLIESFGFMKVAKSSVQ